MLKALADQNLVPAGSPSAAKSKGE
jgi:hypothetical protein